jgi:hypothetical protein
LQGNEASFVFTPTGWTSYYIWKGRLISDGKDMRVEGTAARYGTTCNFTMTRPGAPTTAAASSAKPTGGDLPMPPVGTPEPNSNVPGTTLQGARRFVRVNESVMVPFWLINSKNMANMNFEVLYNIDVVRSEGQIGKGNLLGNALLSTNPKVSGSILVGFAQTTGISGTGTVLNVPFRAVGKPGESSRLHLVVTTINTPDGSVPSIHRIPGEIVITDKDGRVPGTGSTGGTAGGTATGGGGTGTGTGGSSTAGTGTGGTGTGGTGPGGIPPGDCNNDGRLTTLDARCALDISVKNPVRIANPMTLDVDGNKEVTSRDAAIIAQRAVAAVGQGQ